MRVHFQHISYIKHVHLKHDNGGRADMNHLPNDLPNDQNASIIYKDGIASSVLAAERTWLAWIRTIGKCFVSLVCLFSST